MIYIFFQQLGRFSIYYLSVAENQNLLEKELFLLQIQK